MKYFAMKDPKRNSKDAAISKATTKATASKKVYKADEAGFNTLKESETISYSAKRKVAPRTIKVQGVLLKNTSLSATGLPKDFKSYL